MFAAAPLSASIAGPPRDFVAMVVDSFDSAVPLGNSHDDTPSVRDGSSVTDWLDELVAGGKSPAVDKLWQRYFERLTRLARDRLKTTSRRAADEEDVALSAFELFCRRAHEGRFPDLQDRDDLWRLLVALTEHKASDLARRERARKRGGGKVRGNSALGDANSSPATFGEGLPGPAPTPEFAAIAAEECRRLLDALRDDVLRSIALGKLAGKTNDELAAEAHCSLSTIDRKLRVIRTIWEKERGRL